MGNTADLAMVQKTIIDTLHEEGKSLLKVVAVQGVLYQSILMQSWLEGWNWVGKCAQATGMTASLRILSSKADSNTWESFTRSELKLESVHQESPRSDIFRKRATKPLLKQKHRQKHLTWAKEKMNWTVAQWSKVGLNDILHAIVMPILSVKTFLWLAINLHQLLSNGAAVNTQSRRSLTSYVIRVQNHRRIACDSEREIA